jgi:enoyl-CoA hydratase
MSSIFDISKPIIAGVHGHVIAGGTDLALHCDIIIATEDANIGFPPVRSMGTPPTHMWTYLVGPQVAKWFLLTGDTVSGKKAEEMGLVLKSVPRSELSAEVEKLANKMANIPWELLAANKSIVNKALDLMGRNTMQVIAAETDAVAHQAPVVKEFGRISNEKGLKAALEWRDWDFK